MLLEEIKKKILLDNYIITFHAHRRMDERGISTEELVNLILNGRIIEALRYLVWVTSGYRFSIPETKPSNESSMMGD